MPTVLNPAAFVGEIASWVSRAELPMLTRRAVALAALVFACANAGCYKWHNLRERTGNMSRFFSTSYDDPQANEKIARAEQLFTEQQYSKAQDLFKELADNTSNNKELAERARVHAGRVPPRPRGTTPRRWTPTTGC